PFSEWCAHETRDLASVGWYTHRSHPCFWRGWRVDGMDVPARRGLQSAREMPRLLGAVDGGGHENPVRHGAGRPGRCLSALAARLRRVAEARRLPPRPPDVGADPPTDRPGTRGVSPPRRRP